MRHRNFLGSRSNTLKRTSRRRLQVKKLHKVQHQRRIAFFVAEQADS